MSVVASAAALALLLLSSCDFPEPDLNPNQVTDSICFGLHDYILSMALSPDGKHIYVFRYMYPVDDYVTILRVSDHHELRHIAYGNLPWGMMVTPNNRYLYVGDDPYLTDIGGRVWVMDLSNDSIVASVDVMRDPAPLAITPDSRLVFIAGCQGPGVVFNTDRHRVVDTLRDVWRTGAAAVSPDGRRLYIARAGTGLLALDTKTNTAVDSALTGRQVFGLALLPDCDRMYVSVGYDSSVLYVLSLPDLKVEDSIVTEGQLRRLAALPNGDFVYAVGDGVVYAIRTEDNSLTDTIPHGLFEPALYVHPSGDRVYLGPAGGITFTKKILVIGC